MSTTILNSLWNQELHFWWRRSILRHTLRGPGTVYIQSLPSADSLTELLLQHLKQEASRGEGSVLWRLGNLLDGDNRNFYNLIDKRLQKWRGQSFKGSLICGKGWHALFTIFSSLIFFY
jgi:hypothetical protein